MKLDLKVGYLAVDIVEFNIKDFENKHLIIHSKFRGHWHLPLYSITNTGSISTIRIKIILKTWESYITTQAKTASAVYPSNRASLPDKRKYVNFSHYKIDPSIILVDWWFRTCFLSKGLRNYMLSTKNETGQT